MDNARILYDRHPYFFDEQEMWWVWQTDRWEMTDDVEMARLLDNSLGFMGQTVSSTIKNNHLTAMKWVGREKKPQEAKKKWIQFKSKAYSLESHNIYDVTPDYFFTNPIPWGIGESEETPTIDKLIEEWVGKEYVKTAYEIIAYCCLADYPIHLVFCFVGVGRNGKSKFLGLIGKFIGVDNLCSTELDNLLDSRFESAKLYKKLVCQMGETNFSVISKTSLLKKLTGQDLIGFEFKNKKPFDDYNYAKIIIASNSLPTTSDTSEGFFRRWLIINFKNTFPEGRDILQDIPDVEYNNLARKVIRILPELINNAKFDNQGTIEERKHKYILFSNPMPLFLKLCCNPSGFVSYNELYTAYIIYLNENKKRRVKTVEFKAALEDEGFWVERTSKEIGDSWKSGNWVEGISLKNDWKMGISCETYADYVTNLTRYKHPIGEVGMVTQNTQTSQKIEEETIQENTKNDKTYSFDDLATFIREKGNLYPKDEFEAKHGLKTLEDGKKKGYWYEAKHGFLTAL